MTNVRGGSGIPMSSELWRKALHLLSLLIPVGLLYFGRETALLILIPMTLTALLIEVLRTRFEPARRGVDTIFGFMMRPEEIPPVPAPIRFNGATWVLLTSTLLAALFEPTIAAAAIAIGLLGDAAAALVGRRFGRTKIGKSDKTFEGSLAFVLVAAPLIWIVPGLTLPVGFAGLMAGVVVESLPLPINDNFAVPMASALAMSLFFL